ncbi:MAG: hypothetical protein MZV65_25760 [Chromatiales bacterium]|nr:hypothetical protein [Chromatiales bacterium]
MKQRPNHLSSRELLARIGLNEDDPRSLLDDDEPLEDLNGDLGSVLRERYRLLTTAHRFAPGDLGDLEAGTQEPVAHPHYGQPAVVIEVLDTPILRSATTRPAAPISASRSTWCSA